MAAYWGMVLLPFLGKIFDLSKKKLENKYIVRIFFLFFFLLLVCRSESVGNDLVSYKFYFETIHTQSIDKILISDIEPLFYLLNYFIGKLTDSYRVFLVICAILAVGPVWRLYEEEVLMPFLTISLFLLIAPVPIFFSGIRQGIAIGMSAIAYKFVKEKRIFCFLGIVLLASGIHVSAIIILLMYPLYYFKITEKGFAFIMPLLLIIYWQKDVIYSTFLNILGGKYNEKYGGEIVSTGAYGMLILMLILAFYCYTVPAPKRVSEECNGLRNFLLLCSFIQLFAPISNLIMRFGYYYHIFIPVVIPKVISMSEENRKIAKFSVPVMTLFFIFYFFYRLRFTEQCGMYPYFPFWMEG